MSRLESLCDEARRSLEQGDTPLTDRWRALHRVSDREAAAIADMLAAKLSIADIILDRGGQRERR